MSKRYAIRPYFYYEPERTESESVESALELLKDNKVVVVNNLDLVFEILLALGWKQEDANFTVNYALNGASAIQ